MNPAIEEARQAAMDVLKPSRRDLEHGLELHAASLVVDTYAFAPRFTPDVAAVKKLLDEGASDQEVQDAWEDSLIDGKGLSAAAREHYVESWRAAGVTCLFQNAGEECQAQHRLIKRMGYGTWLTDMFRQTVPKVVTPTDIERAQAEGRHCLVLTNNGVPLVERWESVEQELAFVNVFFRLGSRMMHLTYNRRNMIGDGCAEPTDAGLSDFGRAVVAEMNRVGVIVDVAHSGWQTSADAARASNRPMVASHSGAHALGKHHRLKPDAVIDAIAETGGYVGVVCLPAFLGGSGDLNAMLDHVDYLVKRVGADHVGIGTDRAAVPADYDAAVASLGQWRRGRRPMQAFWPANERLESSEWNDPRMVQSLAWTNWPMFTVGLVQRGHSDDDIRKIIGGNALRVAKAVFPDVCEEPAPAAG